MNALRSAMENPVGDGDVIVFDTERKALDVPEIIVETLEELTMESYRFMQTAAALFGAAALGGLLMAGMRFSGIPRPPAWLAMGHGLLAASGLTLLIYAAVAVGIPQIAQIALGLFGIAAVGGAVMNLLFHWKLLPLPVPLMILHALLAVTGFVLLLVCVYGQPHA